MKDVFEQQAATIQTVRNILNRHGCLVASPFHQAHNDKQEQEFLAIFAQDVLEAKAAFIKAFQEPALGERTIHAQFSHDVAIKRYNTALKDVLKRLEVIETAASEKKNACVLDVMHTAESMDKLLHIARGGFVQEPVLEA